MKTANLNGTSVSYKYNSDGLRSYKKVGSTVHEYEYLGDKLMYEKRGSYQFHYRYDAFGNLAGITREDASGSLYRVYVLCNSRGDVLELRNQNGTVFAKYVYDAWGNVLHVLNSAGNEITSTTNLANQNPFRYRGYYYDSESGLYYVSSRYYDPVTCRFINTDELAVITAVPTAFTNKNIYAYCDNNPIVRVDIFGTFWESAFDILSLSASIIEVSLNPTDIWAWASLAGDVVDLIPVVTGVGEITRAARTIDKASTTVQIAKAIDFTDDAADIVKTLDRSKGFTKSTARAGRKIHAGYKVTDDFSKIGKEYRKVKGVRPDYVDFANRTIYELKPMNPRGLKSGIHQLQKYDKALGGGFTLRLELY